LLYGIAFPVLLLLSMFFSASETAFLSASRLHIRYLREKNNRSARRVERLLARKTFFLNTILVGNNIVNISLSSLATALAVSIFGSAGVGIATVTATLLVLLFGEIVPKSLALTYPEKMALRFSLPVTLFGILTLPVVTVFSLLTSLVLHVTGASRKNTAGHVTEEDLRTLIEVGEEEGILESEERDILHRILDFTDLTARDIMTPRTAFVDVELDTGCDALLSLSASSGFSRFPVRGDDIDDIQGIVYIKDLLMTGKCCDPTVRARDIMRKALFVFETQSIPLLQEKLKTENQNCAIVLDEYGGTAGLITIEDIFEEIFGSIQDEFDHVGNTPGQSVEHGSKNDEDLLIPGAERIDTVNTLLDIHLESRFYDTIAGFLLERAADIPAQGFSVEEQDHVFTVHERSGNRIETVRITRTGGAE
jgi:CBS domain containing-hemolysin-like protein